MGCVFAPPASADALVITIWTSRLRRLSRRLPPSPPRSSLRALRPWAELWRPSPTGPCGGGSDPPCRWSRRSRSPDDRRDCLRPPGSRPPPATVLSREKKSPPPCSRGAAPPHNRRLEGRTQRARRPPHLRERVYQGLPSG